jgi:hypothetical protein
MTRINAVVADFESIRFETSKKSFVHTIVVIPITIKTGKMSQYSLFTEKALVIKITDVLSNKDVKEFLDALHEVEHLEQKHRNDERLCGQHGVRIRYLRFKDAVKTFSSFIKMNGGTLFMHNLLGDLQALVDTQNLVRGPRIVKNKLAKYPNTGTYIREWKDFKFGCTMSILCNRCPNFRTEYKGWVSENNIFLGKGMNTLQSLSKFVRREPGYEQAHAAVQDTIDLFHVLKYAVKCDGPILDGFSYIAEPKWILAV